MVEVIQYSIMFYLYEIRFADNGCIYKISIPSPESRKFPHRYIIISVLIPYLDVIYDGSQVIYCHLSAV